MSRLVALVESFGMRVGHVGWHGARQAACVAAVALLAGLQFPVSVSGQPATPATRNHLTIPYLGNTAPGDIEFAAAECDITPSGSAMRCHFRQVFITRASFDQTACVITSNGYEQQFQRETPTTWVGVTAPEGDCGVVDEARLEDGGGTRWTMTLTSKATRALDRAECRSVSTTPRIVYSARDIKRPLTCATIQPGSIER